jgi:hypothetical protein
VRIRDLQRETTQLLSQNFALREQVIQLQTEATAAGGQRQRALAHVELVQARLAASSASWAS